MRPMSVQSAADLMRNQFESELNLCASTLGEAMQWEVRRWMEEEEMRWDMRRGVRCDVDC